MAGIGLGLELTWVVPDKIQSCKTVVVVKANP